MWKLLFVLSLSLITKFSTHAVELKPGAWKLAVARNVDADVAVCIVQLTNDNGKWSASLVARNPLMGKVVVDGVDLTDKLLHLRLQVSDEPVMFEGVVGGERRIRGSYGNEQRLVIATLLPTTDQRIDRDSMMIPRDTPAPVKQYLRLETEKNRLTNLVAKSVGDDHDRLKDDLANHQRKMDEQLPPLFATILKDHADHSAACDIGLSLLSSAYRSNTPVEQVRQWTQTSLKSAEQFGPGFRRDVLLKLTEYVGRYDAAADIAVELGKQAEQAIGPQAPPAIQARVLSFLVDAMAKAGQAEAAQPFRERLDKLEAAFDAEYQKRIPKWDIKPYTTRAKPKANQVALVELFTGAECQPCVAASVACARLAEMFKPSEVIVLQYHLNTSIHDPLANADTQARHDFYSASHSDHANSLPAIFVNGLPRATGGGNLSQSRRKFDELLPFIHRVLDARVEAKLDFSVKRDGDNITLIAKTDGMAENPDGLKLRLAIVEDTVRYGGSNGMRFHRHVVRAMPGTAAGHTLTKPAETKETTVSLNELKRKTLTYLNEYAKEETPYPRPYPAIELKNLKAVAWVQDDRRREVFLSKCVDINGGERSKSDN